MFLANNYQNNDMIWEMITLRPSNAEFPNFESWETQGESRST
jgi:hypothetical protein